MDFKHMGLEDLGPEDFVYFDLPYLSGRVQSYSPETVDFPYSFRLLEAAKFRWLLSEYPESILFEHFGMTPTKAISLHDPNFLPPTEADSLKSLAL
jgi:hypothetical protein